MGSFIFLILSFIILYYIVKMARIEPKEDKDTKQYIEDESIGEEVNVSSSSDKTSITINSLGDLARAATSAYGKEVYKTFCQVGVDEVIERLLKINTKEAALYCYFTTIVMLYLNPFSLSKEEYEKQLQKKEKELAFFCNKHGVELYMSANHGYVITKKGYFEVYAKIPYSVRKRVGMPILPREKELAKILDGACLNVKENLEKVLNEFFEENRI